MENYCIVCNAPLKTYSEKVAARCQPCFEKQLIKPLQWWEGLTQAQRIKHIPSNACASVTEVEIERYYNSEH